MGEIRCCAARVWRRRCSWPENARALYYLALVERRQGHPEAEIADLQKVVKQFPQSRDARRELGIAYYQQHRSEDARHNLKLSRRSIQTTSRPLQPRGLLSAHGHEGQGLGTGRTFRHQAGWIRARQPTRWIFSASIPKSRLKASLAHTQRLNLLRTSAVAGSPVAVNGK